jgi:hypothetical protein
MNSNNAGAKRGMSVSKLIRCVIDSVTGDNVTDDRSSLSLRLTAPPIMTLKQESLYGEIFLEFIQFFQPSSPGSMRRARPEGLKA